MMLRSSGAIRSSAQPFECFAISSSSSGLCSSTAVASSTEKGLASSSSSPSGRPVTSC